jgi:hypothetical protein
MRISTRQQRGSGRTAHDLRIEIREFRTVLRQRIDARCPNRRGPVATQITIALIIGKDDDDVRFVVAISIGSDRTRTANQNGNKAQP